MVVVQVSEEVEVEANCVYVIPPGKNLLMVDGQLVLKDLQHENGKRSAVDIFFRTLADTHGPRSAAIVLSGSGGDGAIGIKRIKENGGLTVVQAPEEAEHDGMPRAAIATGMVDWVLPVAEMPDRLLEYQRIQKRVRLPEENPLCSPGSRNRMMKSLCAKRFPFYECARVMISPTTNEAQSCAGLVAECR